MSHLPWNRRRERDLTDELESHIRLAIADRVARGESHADAERAARRELGNELLVREATRRQWGWLHVERVLSELVQSFRSLRRTKLLALGAVLALALGIGATTTLFSIVHGATRKLPFPEPEELVVITQTQVRDGRDDMGARPFDYVMWVQRQTSFEGIAAFSTSAMNLADPAARPERRSGVRITPAAFGLLGVEAARGRLFSEDDASRAAPAVAMIAHDLWQARYAADPGIVGRVIRIDGEPHTVVGVMPRGFAFPVSHDIWVPLRDESGVDPDTGPYLSVFGRLHDDVPLRQARAEMAGIAAHAAAGWPATHADRGIRIMPFVDYEMDPGMVPVLYLMLLAVSFVLVIACANVANLLLARGATRTKEVGIRTALGASRGHIIVQHLIESFVLALPGGAAGLLIAYASVRFFDAATANIIEAFWIDFRVDGVVLAFTTLLVAGAAVGAGILPALRASGASSAGILKDATGAGNLRIGRLSRALVVAQIALMCGLLAVSGTFVKAAIGLRAIDLPFDARAILTAELSFTDTRISDEGSRERMLREISRAVHALPGVEAAALTSVLPGRGAGRNSFMLADDPDGTARATGVALVTPGFLDVLGARALLGRDFTWADGSGAQRVALVNTSWVRRHSPTRDPLGLTILFAPDRPITIVGVVPDLQMQDPEDADGAGVYLSALQSRPYGVTIMARAAGDPLALAPALRTATEGIAADVPLFDVATLHHAIYSEKQVLDAFAALFAVVGIGALLLAVVGVYGVVSFGVAQRTREFGVRIALGARRADIIALVTGQGSVAVGIGAVLGLMLAAALHYAVASAIEIMEPGDMLLFVGVLSVLVITAAVGLLVPAWRAAATEPLEALRDG